MTFIYAYCTTSTFFYREREAPKCDDFVEENTITPDI